MSQFDVLCVGDIVTDAFIKLLEDQATSYDNDRGKWLAIPFGQKVPYDHVAAVKVAADISYEATRKAQPRETNGGICGVANRF